MKTCSARATSRAAPSSSMAFDRRLIVMLRPSSSKRTFSSRVPKNVSMLGLTPMLFFIQFKTTHVGMAASAVRPRLSLVAADTELLRYTHACSTSGTKHSFAWEQDQPECACPEGKSLPLHSSLPRGEQGVNGRRLEVVIVFNRR